MNALHRITITLTHGAPVELSYRGLDTAKTAFETLNNPEEAHVEVFDHFGTTFACSTFAIVAVKLSDMAEAMKADAEAHLIALRAQAKMQNAINSDLTLRTASSLHQANGLVSGRG